MSESDIYDSVDEYTSIMDDHVVESRTDNLGLVSVQKRRLLISNEEVEDGIPEVHIQTPGILNNASLGRRGTSNSEQNRSRNYREEEEGKEEEKNKEEEGWIFSECIMRLYVPVSCSILIVLATISSTNFYTTKGRTLIYILFHEDSSDISTKVWQAVANSLILTVIIVLMTVSLVILHKYEFYKLVHALLIISSLMMLSVFSILYWEQILKAYNIPMDLFTLGLVSWNFGVVGIICLYWKGPTLLQHVYLIFMSALMALGLIKYLPEWTSWVFLSVISIWDLCAVLTPKGPLRILVEAAKEQKELLFPALVYSCTIMYTVVISYAGYVQAPMTTNGNQSNAASRDAEVDRGARRAQRREDTLSLTERSGQQDNRVSRKLSGGYITHISEPQLGLGDFVLYSFLVGKASSYGDWNTTLTCYAAVLIGLYLTITLVLLHRKMLPALPITITFGLTCYFAIRVIVAPFVDNLASRQVFI